MRDPGRIDLVLRHLERVWRANPDLRLGQLVRNAVVPGRLAHAEEAELVAGSQALETSKAKKAPGAGRVAALRAL